jgi:hypothetical protein
MLLDSFLMEAVSALGFLESAFTTSLAQGPSLLKDGALHALKDSIMSKLQKDWPPAVQVNWLLWVPAQFINFKFVPPNLRVSLLV